MKICVIAYKFGSEKEIGEHLGTYHYFIEKMRRIACLGHEVIVIAPWLSFFKKGSGAVDNVKIIRYYPPLFNRPKLLLINSFLRSIYIKATQRIVLKINDTENFDVFYVWQARETGFAVAQIRDKLKAPFFFRQITAWKWHFERGLIDSKIQKKFAETIYEKADQIVFVSRAASREALASGLSPDKIEIIGIGIEEDIFVPDNRKGEIKKELGIRAQKVILFIGRINFEEKGIGYLLDAFSEISKLGSQAKLAIIGGGGESERMRSQISKLGIGDQVILAGKQPFAKLPKYLNASDVLVVPSIWLEHFGQVTIEAMSCGVPVVTSDVGGSPEINVDGETGFVVPAKNAHALAEAVLKILSDKNLAAKLGHAARKRVLENFTFKILIGKFLHLIEKHKNG